MTRTIRMPALALVLAVVCGCGCDADDGTEADADALAQRVTELELEASEELTPAHDLELAMMFTFERAACDRVVELAETEGLLTDARADAIRARHWLACLDELSRVAAGLDDDHLERLHACAKQATTRVEIFGCYRDRGPE